MKYGKRKRGAQGGGEEETLAQEVVIAAKAPDASPDAHAALAQTEPSAEEAPTPNGEEEIPPSLHARFEAFTLLGRGGMGVVYKARDLRLHRDVAIKLLFGADAESGGSILREARSQARITHENVCKVYEAGTAERVRYIVMQLLRGQPFDRAAASMSVEEKVRVVRQIAGALHEAHRLGLVHRDVKPSNIMVERDEDGAYRPYIMDFGLAREMGDSGATVSGALMGTPSFMAPEQAAGRVRALDRRTDVYGLGATLYDVLVGRPPLVVEGGLAPLLHAIVEEEPLAARQVAPEVPLDLDAIVMKCLEKQPARRYESAKALGDDLQRFLDGEAVQALKRAWLYALLRRARRHRLKLTIGSAALVVCILFLGGWLSQRARAEEQATLSRELGESVKEMEFFLRNAHGLPLHDLNRERNIVRTRLNAIEAKMRAAGEVGLGPGHYALGRGRLALQEPEEALSHLRQAEAAGYRAAGLDYALGLALGEMYRAALADTKRMEGEQKKKRIKEIEAAYKEPALLHLRAALAASDAIEAPAYAEGLLAFYEGRYEDALKKTREAFEATPWLYEAKRVEGDALFEIGRKFGHDAAFHYETMAKWFGEAEAAYRIAAESGRSDPAVHLSMCELATQSLCGAYAHGDPMRPQLDVAKTACERAIAANPTSGAGHVALAQAFVQYAWRIAASSKPEQNVEEALKEAARYAETASAKSEEGPMAPYAVGMVWRSWLIYASDRARPIEPAATKAIAAYDEALKRDPTFVWALNESCSAYYFRALDERSRGIDVHRSVEEGLGRCERAFEVAPSFVYATITAITHWLLKAAQNVERGRSPSAEVQEVDKLVERLRVQSPQSKLAIRSPARAALLEATYLLESGGDPMPPLMRAEAGLKAHAALEPTTAATQKLRGETARLRARILILRGEDPSASLNEAMDAFEKLLEARPWDAEHRALRADIEVLALRATLPREEDPTSRLEQALARLNTLLDPTMQEPGLSLALGELHELRALHSRKTGASAETAITEGLQALDRALALHPHLAKAFACKGRLLLLRAKSVRDRADAHEAAKRSVDALNAAIRENPWMERLEKEALAEAQRLSSTDALR